MKTTKKRAKSRPRANGIAAYNRGSRVIREQIDRELAERRVIRRRPVAAQPPARRAPVGMLKYYATVELLPSQHAAIVTLHDQTGEWSGSGRVELKHLAFETQEKLRSRLYEVGYIYAAANAEGKGGRLEAYRAVGK